MVEIANRQGNSENGYYLNIEGYYDKIHRTTWARRTAGMLAGGTLGAAYGAIAGVAVAFLPYVLGALQVSGVTAAAAALPGLAAIGSSVALFSAILAGIGMLITADVAANSASSAVGFEEKERREKLEEMKGKCVGPECPPAETAKKEEEKGPPLFSWKVAAITIPLFAAFGGLIAFNDYTASTVIKAAFEGLSGPAAKVASAATFGLFGAFLGTKSSMFSNTLTNFYYKVVTGKLFQHEPQREMALSSPQLETALADDRTIAQTIDEPAREGKSFAAGTTRFSLQGLIEKSTKPVSEQDAVLTR